MLHLPLSIYQLQVIKVSPSLALPSSHISLQKGKWIIKKDEVCWHILMLPRHSFRAEDYREQCSLMHGLLRYIISHPAPLLHPRLLPLSLIFLFPNAAACGAGVLCARVTTFSSFTWLTQTLYFSACFFQFFRWLEAWAWMDFWISGDWFQNWFQQESFSCKARDWLTRQVSNILTKMDSSRSN